MELKNKANFLNNILTRKTKSWGSYRPFQVMCCQMRFSFLKNNPQIELNIKGNDDGKHYKSSKIRGIGCGNHFYTLQLRQMSSIRIFFSMRNWCYILLIKSLELGKDCFVVPEDIDVDKVWLLEEGNCLRTQFEDILSAEENSLKPSNLEFFGF